MTYYINKIIGWLLSPLGLIYLSALVAYLLVRFDFRRTAKALVSATLITLWVCSSGLFVDKLGAYLESYYPQLPINEIPEGGVIVLLGGSMGINPTASNTAEMYSSADRVWEAARLWKAKKAPIIYCTDEKDRLSTLPLLRDLGVPEEVVYFADVSRNTQEEAKHVAEEFKDRKVLLVTSAWHMKRAEYLFLKAGVDTVPCATDHESTVATSRSFTIGDVFPSAQSFAKATYLVKEVVALTAYGCLF